jgi:hypothetical protein
MEGTGVIGTEVIGKLSQIAKTLERDIKRLVRL